MQTRNTSTATDGESNGNDDDAIERLAETTGFQRDALFAIDQFDGRPTGVQIGEALADWYGVDVGQSRLYRNLRELLDEELLATFPVDGRTNSYYLTPTGRRCVRSYRRLITGRRPVEADGAEPAPEGERR